MPDAATFNYGPLKTEMYMSAKLLQLCLTLCDPMNCSPPGSSVCGLSQARILEWLPFELL